MRTALAALAALLAVLPGAASAACIPTPYKVLAAGLTTRASESVADFWVMPDGKEMVEIWTSAPGILGDSTYSVVVIDLHPLVGKRACLASAGTYWPVRHASI